MDEVILDLEWKPDVHYLKTCFVNGEALVSNMKPSAEIVHKSAKLMADFAVKGISISQVADEIVKMKMKGKDLALIAFCVGCIVAEFNKKVRKSLTEKLMGETIYSVCKEAQEGFADTGKDELTVKIEAIIIFSVLCYIKSELHKKMLKRLTDEK